MIYYLSVLLAFLMSSAACSMIPTRSFTKPDLKANQRIVLFKPEHEKKIMAIALWEAPLLTSVHRHTPREYFTALDEHIQPALHARSMTTLVFLENNEPVGFITYAFSMPWYSFLMNQKNPNATLCLLAVEKAARKKGYGSALVRAALAECHDKSVNRVSLWVTASGAGLGAFYEKLGFKLVRKTKLFEEQYAVRLQPHPIKRLLKDMLK